MDQTGLSQKAGAVVSHLHLARAAGRAGRRPSSARPEPISTCRATSCRRRPRGTWTRSSQAGPIAVVDSDSRPRRRCCRPTPPPPDVAALERLIRERVGSTTAPRSSTPSGSPGLLGNHLLANVVLLGAAYQLGGCPCRGSDIGRDRSGRRGGAPPPPSRRSHWGRWAVHDPAAVEHRLHGAGSREARPRPSSIRHPRPSCRPSGACEPERSRRTDGDLLERRTAQVIDYQDFGQGEAVPRSGRDGGVPR